ANLYIFDEPTSYLDIKQRIKVSKFIRNLADHNTAVLVVEHDLIILDYMTDAVHIMYGKESAYGVVSTPKATRAGMNVYLSGYLREENMRFRDYPITFSASPPAQVHKGTSLISWGNLTKKLGSFNLTAESGGISTQNVTGILGENGIGKTSFVKILAGVIEKDAGTVDSAVRVAYKPQYLSREEPDLLVITFLHDAITKYEVQLIRPLDLKPLLLQKLGELSGGQLQRVAVARCLSQDADLYLLDEPSAYLDVEQRLIVSKVIRDLMTEKGTSALVVDHDLLFTDYLSQSLIVFEGVPAVSGSVHGPMSMEAGMNRFLRKLGITLRRDKENHRPRINKPDSVKDREQREKGKWYYT
ncbi:ribosome biogenesis/translation initiation ATPase RLI, partial [Candidatus Woesearchaeota archaeon CG_4_10_14_0_8_um_filter_47_5]